MSILVPALIATLLVAASACGPGRPVSVSLAALAANQDAYQGREITAQGVVRRFTDVFGPYFVIEDSRQDRVEVLPASRVARYEGMRIQVTGMFDVNQTIGRFIQAEQISVKPITRR